MNCEKLGYILPLNLIFDVFPVILNLSESVLIHELKFGLKLIRHNHLTCLEKVAILDLDSL